MCTKTLSFSPWGFSSSFPQFSSSSPILLIVKCFSSRDRSYSFPTSKPALSPHCLQGNTLNFQAPSSFSPGVEFWLSPGALPSSSQADSGDTSVPQSILSPRLSLASHPASETQPRCHFFREASDAAPTLTQGWSPLPLRSHSTHVITSCLFIYTSCSLFSGQLPGAVEPAFLT